MSDLPTATTSYGGVAAPGGHVGRAGKSGRTTSGSGARETRTVPTENGQSPTQNHLLSKLTPALLARLSSRLECVPMLLGTQLYGPGDAIRYAYFPTTAIISLHYVTASGGSIETASVGNEGVIGFAAFTGDGVSPDAAVVQTGGYAYRLPRAILHAEFQRESGLRQILLRHTQAMITQILLNAACNRHHVIEQQLARLLLLTLDRLPSPDMLITHELIASMLGVRREGITEAAGNLQSAGVIQYRRGHITVLDRAGLESRTCECYGVIKSEWARLAKCTS
jgi:CRP-like cAMP-binding protein